jgi:hypothetical protein
MYRCLLLPLGFGDYKPVGLVPSKAVITREAD